MKPTKSNQRQKPPVLLGISDWFLEQYGEVAGNILLLWRSGLSSLRDGEEMA